MLIYGLIGFITGLLAFLLASSPKLPPDTDAIIDQVLENDLPELVTGQVGYATSQGLQIWYEAIQPDSPIKGTLLLIMSIGGSAAEWFPSFLDTYVSAGYQVIRYDHRGTGLSDRVENWQRDQAYSIGDMAQDALAVLDALKIERCHVFGLSMGGMVAQELAIQNPDRVASLTLAMTSGNVGDETLPSLSSLYLVGSFLSSLGLLRYRMMGGEKNLIKERIAKYISFVGHEGLNIQETAETTLYSLRKHGGLNFSAVFQHQMAVTISGSRYDKLGSLQTPTLVIHGTQDRLIPIEHGKKLVDILPNATGIWLQKVGHIWPYPNMAQINQQVLDHLDYASRMR